MKTKKLTLREAVWGDEPEQQRFEDESNAINAANELAKMLSDMGDYENFELASKLVQAMRKSYGR